MSNQFVLLKNKGLSTFPNDLSEDPPGSHRQSDNVVIDRESVVEPRRGIAQFGLPFSATTSDRAQQLIEYKDRLIVQYGAKLAYDSTGLGDFVDFSGAVRSASEFRLKHVEANGNLYFLTDTGPKKLGVETTEQLDFAEIVDIGVPRALSIQGTLVAGSVVFDALDQTVGYQVIYGYNDFNSNLLLGAPSGTFAISHFAVDVNRNVQLTFAIPKDILNSPIADRFFYQVYRSPRVSGLGAEVGGDFNLVLENFPTEAELLAGTIVLTDIYPDTLRQTSTPLYTSSTAGEGALQSNERPPFAQDITIYNGYTFYANTSTVHRKSITLLTGTNVLQGEKITFDDGVDPPQTYTFTDTPVAVTDVLISVSASPAVAVFETATNLVNAINANVDELAVYAFYDSLPAELPGRIRFEQQSVVGPKFFISASPAISSFFDPSLPSKAITAISVNNPTQITSVAHGLTSGTQIRVYATDSTPPISALQTVTVLTPDIFTIPVNVTVAGTTGYFVKIANLISSDNEVRPNRLYYSKFQQPESVPLANFVDIGPRDKPILRVIALRDSLFVFKEDAIYRLSGEVAPFTVVIFDSSAILVAPDSCAVLNNQIYCLSTQGVIVVTDTGVQVISRPIEDQFLSITRDGFQFRTQTFGVAYESDRSYLLFTVRNELDAHPTQCLRFNSFTRTWTRWNVSHTCCIVSDSIIDVNNKRVNDRLYLGASDASFVERERKDRTRTDFADRDFETLIVTDGVSGTSVKLGTIAGLSFGDVLVQTQHLTINRFNQLLGKLDLDQVITETDFLSSTQMLPGDGMLLKITALAAKLDLDPDLDGDYSSFYIGPVSTNQEQQAYYNAILAKLDADSGAFFTNYFSVLQSVGSLEYEGAIIAINPNLVTITTSTALPFIRGIARIFKRIDTTVVWSPASFGDVSLFKQVSEGTVIFEDNNFSAATIGYGSDLSPGFENIEFSGAGNGNWGIFQYGGLNWGGTSSAKPLRTFIPRQKQRCRFLIVRFQHNVAREKYSIYGISLTFRPYSNKAYR